jgi:hypothetical protein
VYDSGTCTCGCVAAHCFQSSRQPWGACTLSFAKDAPFTPPRYSYGYGHGAVPPLLGRGGANADSAITFHERRGAIGPRALCTPTARACDRSPPQPFARCDSAGRRCAGGERRAGQRDARGSRALHHGLCTGPPCRHDVLRRSVVGGSLRLARKSCAGGRADSEEKSEIQTVSNIRKYGALSLVCLVVVAMYLLTREHHTCVSLP